MTSTPEPMTRSSLDSWWPPYKVFRRCAWCSAVMARTEPKTAHLACVELFGEPQTEETVAKVLVAKEQSDDLSMHLYNFAGVEAFAEVLRVSMDVRLGARRCMELARECVAAHEAQRFPDALSVQGDVPVALRALDNFLEHRYKLVADEWKLAPLSESRVGDVVFYCGWSCVVEDDGDGRWKLRSDGLRVAGVTNETVVACRKIPRRSSLPGLPGARGRERND